MKATPGTISGEGAFPTSRAFDSHGGMAKTPDDLAMIMGILMNEDFDSSLSSSWRSIALGFVEKIMGILMNKNFDSSLSSPWRGIALGFVDPTLWQPASFVVEDNEDFRAQAVRH